ncbi:hypothetical protein niasHT_016682 [Heterodera trifolii]|uniref:Histone-lysine N-methyltransferase n=1 Tax=Heterodera trifolii TaxID=157864 RepID=A0ABD2KUD7_9BILA
MSLGLFPSSTAVYSSNSDNKNDQNNKFRGSTVLRASSENSATSNNSSGFALSNQQKAPFSIAERAATAAQRPHRRGISPFKQQQQQPNGVISVHGADMDGIAQSDQKDHFLLNFFVGKVTEGAVVAAQSPQRNHHHLNEFEKQLMRENGFNHRVAVCNTNFDTVNRSTIGRLEAFYLAFGVEGEKLTKRLFGGQDNSHFSQETRLAPQIEPTITKILLNSSSSSSCFSKVSGDGMRPVTDDNQWVVEKILKKRVTVCDGMRNVSYFLKWEGWDYSFSSWEEHSKENSLDLLVKKFERRTKWRKAIYERELRGVLKRNKRFTYNFWNWLDNRCVFYACHRWEDEMNAVIRVWEKRNKCKQAPIYVENWVDDQIPPTDFAFVLENTFSSRVQQYMKGFLKLEFCMCKANGLTCGAAVNCCSEIFGQLYCYGENSKLDVCKARGNWIVECTDGCSCDIYCPTRVVQRGRQIPIVIFRTLDRGWSVRTAASIQRHQFVCEYIGEVLTVDDAFVPSRPSIYQFQMDGAGEHKLKFVVDAVSYGNEARFINHSCSPNLVVRAVFADRFDESYHRIAFFAKRDIKTGEELTIDYCAIDGNAKGRQKKECTCRSSKCRGFFYY